MRDNEISRTKKKQAARALHDIGIKLIKLPESKLRAANLPEPLITALVAAKPMTMIALRRQKLFIGRLLRAMGPDVSLARELVETSNERARADAARYQRLAHWRDRLIAEGDPALEALIEVNPEVDRQQIRQLVRVANKEAAEGRPPTARRRLFHHLRDAFKLAASQSTDEATTDSDETDDAVDDFDAMEGDADHSDGDDDAEAGNGEDDEDWDDADDSEEADEESDPS